MAGHLRAAPDADEPGTHDTKLHEACKAAKRLRYAAEVTVLGTGEPGRTVGVSGPRVQDAVVTSLVWRKIAVGSAGQEAFRYGGLSEREAANIRAAEEALPSAWRDTRRRLAKVVHSR